MDRPPVCRLCRQVHRRVAESGMDKRWKHLSAKPSARLELLMRVVTDDDVDRVQVYRRRRHSRALLIARSFHSACPCLRQCLYAFRNSFSCPCHGHPYGVHSGTPANFSGGHCAGVPPLPIPNREVKPGCADGTAMQCGRVGSCLFLCGPWLRK